MARVNRPDTTAARLLGPLAAVALAVAAAPAPAHAQPTPSKSRLQAAKSYVDAGLAAQKSGDYDTALMLYKKAYALVPHPVLLFNMAQAHRLAGHAEQALALYRKYLKVDPRGTEARTARELVAELEAKQADAELARGSEGADAAGGGKRAAGSDDAADGGKRPRRSDEAADGGRRSGKSDDAADGGKRSGKSDDAADGGKRPGKSDDAADGGKRPGKSDDNRGAPGDRARRGRGTAAADRADAQREDGGDGADEDTGHGDTDRGDAAPGATAPRPAETPDVDTRGEPARARPLPLARVDLGASYSARGLSYDVRPGLVNAPPQGSYPAGGLRIDGELYPFALADPAGGLAGLGLAVSYDRGLLVHAQIPGAADPVSVDQSHGRIGARFRVGLGGASSLTLGLDYARRQYTFDRSSQTTPLDVPDVDYASIDPVIGAEVPLSTTVRAFAGLEAMFMFDAGPISDGMSYGRSTVYGFEATGGVEFALSRQVRLRLTLEYSTIALAFNLSNQMTAGRDGDLSTKDIAGATDRSLGAVATVGLAY